MLVERLYCYCVFFVAVVFVGVGVAGVVSLVGVAGIVGVIIVVVVVVVVVIRFCYGCS